MAENLETSVCIAGAGPVGLTLGLELARRGIDLVVVEPRGAGEPPSVRCNHVSARSMEIFRRLGLARTLREAGLPEDFPNDVSYRTCATGIELTRIPIPCRRDRYTATDGPDTWWPTPEPPHRINQIFMEPLLFRALAAMPNVRILNRASVEGLEQRADGVLVTVHDLDGGGERTVAARFLAGCDGGRSAVRRLIGGKLEGDAVVQRVQSTYIRAPGLLPLVGRPAWAMFALNPRRSGNVYAIDGRETWLVHNYLKPDEADFDAVDRDWAIRTILGVGPDFRYEVISKEDWFGRRLLADRFREGRVFLAGDSAHIWVPYAGYGMNAGIADADDLAWLLGAHLAGWAPESILNAYERERRPITEQVSRFAMEHAHHMARQRGAVPATIEEPGPEGEAARAALGRAAYDLNVQQYCCAGLNFGCYYDDSPIVAYDGEPAPAYSMADFTPSTVPGCRLPHFWLPDGGSLYDALGPNYTLLRLDPDADPGPLLEAAAARSLPMELLDIPAAAPPECYRHALVLARPDQHVAWRGDTAPSRATALVDRVRGAA